MQRTLGAFGQRCKALELCECWGSLDAPLGPPESDSDDDADGGSAEVQPVEEVHTIFSTRRLAALAQALPNLEELTLRFFRIRRGVLPRLCTSLPHLTRLNLYAPCGAVAATDLVAFCVTAPRPISLVFGGRIGLAEQREIDKANHTLSSYSNVLGTVQTQFRF